MCSIWDSEGSIEFFLIFCSRLFFSWCFLRGSYLGDRVINYILIGYFNNALRLKRDSFLMVIVISGSTRVIFNNMLLYTYYVYDAKVNFT